MCHTAQPVQVGTTTHILPPSCRVYLSAPGVHYNDKYWENATELKPERWSQAHSYSNGDTNTILSNDHTTNSAPNSIKQAKSSSLTADKTRQMRGTLFTFSDGSRACLGRKFAQAEYIAFFAALLRDFEVTFAEGVDREQARRDLNLKCAGKVTLAPLVRSRLKLNRRAELQVDSEQEFPQKSV